MPPQADFADDQLGEALHALVTGQALPPIAGEWLLTGILQALRSDRSLDACLGLSKRGRNSLRSRVRRLQRDQALARAAAAVAADDAVELWARCSRLAPLIRDFSRSSWCRRGVQRLVYTPSDWPVWKVFVLRAMQTGVPLPSTAEGLYKALNANTTFCVSERGVTVLARFL